MEKKGYCFTCDDDVRILEKKELISMTIDGIKVEFLGTIAYCEKCGEEVYVAEINNENIQLANKIYREKLGIIQVDEIRDILEKYDIGQKPLSKLLGWGETTISRYLSGLTPSKEYSDKLKRISNPYEMYEIFTQNKSVIKEVAQKKLEYSLKNLLNGNNLLDKNDYEENISSLDVARYFLSKIDYEAGDLISHLKLQKLVYFAQAWALAFYNKTIFCEDFQAWQHGPVIPDLYIHYRDFGSSPIPKLDFFNEDIFSEEYKNIIIMVWNVYGKYNAKLLEQITHFEDPWKKQRQGCKNFDRCINIIPKDDILYYYHNVKQDYDINSEIDLDKYVHNLITSNEFKLSYY